MELPDIQRKIHEIRGQKVMLDFDLAVMYGIETKRLKETVRRNCKRFPFDFMFELEKEELESLRSQIATSNKRGGTRYMPFAFTEQGVAMLSSVLNSDTAIETNVKIMRAFVAVRQMLENPPVDEVKELQQEIRALKEYVENVFADYNDINEDTRIQLELINKTLAELQMQKRIDNKRLPVGYTAPQYRNKQ